MNPLLDLYEIFSSHAGHIGLEPSLFKNLCFRMTMSSVRLGVKYLRGVSKPGGTDVEFYTV